MVTARSEDVGFLIWRVVEWLAGMARFTGLAQLMPSFLLQFLLWAGSLAKISARATGISANRGIPPSHINTTKMLWSWADLALKSGPAWPDCVRSQSKIVLWLSFIDFLLLSVRFVTQGWRLIRRPFVDCLASPSREAKFDWDSVSHNNLSLVAVPRGGTRDFKWRGWSNRAKSQTQKNP